MKHIHEIRARMQPLDPAPAPAASDSTPRVRLRHVAMLPLRHPADCDLLGVGTDGTLYVEEIIDDGDRVVQHVVNPAGDIVASVDDAAPGPFVPLTLPPDAIRARSPRDTIALNFSGPRLRGLCEHDRVQELVQPLTMPDRMALVERLKLDVLPPHVLGLAESYVLAEAALTPVLFVVCRRVRIVYRLNEPRRERDGTPYDYDTVTVVLKTESGKQAIITNSRRAVYGYDQRVEAFGSAGMAISENRTLDQVRLYGAEFTDRAAPLKNFFIDRYADAFAAEIGAFVDAIEQGKPVPVGFEDGRQALLLAEAAIRSAAEGRTVATREIA